MLAFFSALQMELGGEIHRKAVSPEQADAPDAEPHVDFVTHVGGHDLRLESAGDLICIRAAVPNRVDLSLTPETMGTRVLDGLHLSREVHLGDEAFDDAWVIRAPSLEEARHVLTPAARRLIDQLAPFVSLELHGGSCRVKKSILGESVGHSDDDYNPQQCIEDLRVFAQLIELWGAPRVVPFECK